MKKIGIKSQFKIISIASFFFQIIFLIASLSVLWQFHYDRSLVTFSFFLILLYLSYNSFKFGMSFKIKLGRDLQKTMQNDQSKNMNRSQKRKFIRKNGSIKS
jgi:hypothetical protein